MLTQEQLDIFEQQVSAAVETHLANGGKLCRGRFFTPDGSCMCPIACITDMTPGYGYERKLSDKLFFTVDHGQMFSFIHGFDNPQADPEPGDEQALVEVGKRIRAKYLPVSE
jgi:hypothetical protein